ncbi:MAG: phosphoenolpyruvate-utilizing N-terminal domain-containing protein, partial [Levilactobacillus brevis]
MTKTLKGIAASDGIGIAKAYCLVAPDLSFQTKTIADSASEVKRLEQALQAATSDLTQIRDKALANLGQDEAAVFEAHMAILADPDMVGQIKELITTKMINAEAALQTVTDQFITIFDGMTDNPYMQERSADVKDVTKRVLSHLLNRPLPDPALIDEPVIIVAHDLTPSETAQMNRQFVKGFLTDLGGRTSHSAIMSRTLEIPAVVGTENATQ